MRLLSSASHRAGRACVLVRYRSNGNLSNAGSQIGSLGLRDFLRGEALETGTGGTRQGGRGGAEEALTVGERERERFARVLGLLGIVGLYAV